MSAALTRGGFGRAARLAVGALAVALVALWPRTTSAQVLERTVRLAILEVGDSTFSFDAGSLRWVKPGERGMAVDPKRRDALVARFSVLDVQAGKATALITGETTRLTPEHVVVLEVPLRPWYRSTLFWSGAVLGALGGLIAGSR